MTLPITIAAAELSHETNTFSSVPTDLAAFERVGLRRGPAVRHALRNSATSFAGFFDAAEAHGYLLVPILAVWATPSGMVDGDTLRGLVGEIVAGITATRPDGVLLALHGAMVSEVDTDGDAWILEQVREAVGPHVPIVATLDLHANISERMVAVADVLIGYDTYPHIDQRERAVEASDLLLRLIRGEARPTSALVKPPMMPTSQNMTTDREPMATLIALAREVEQRHGVLNVTIAGGFPPADTSATGFSVLVTTDADRGMARAYALEIAQVAWQRRGEFLGGVTSFEEAAKILAEPRDAPLVLVDIGDNPWTGGPGDSAELLRFLLDQGVTNAALAAITDPVAVRHCVSAGPGAQVELNLGGHTDRLHGESVRITGYVKLLADGRYRNLGPMHAGVDVNLGPTAVVQTGGVHVLITSYAETPIDLNVFRAHGIEPTMCSVLALKGKGHFRAAFEPIAGRVVLVEGPGITGSDLSRLTFVQVPRPIWPIDADATWEPERAE